MHDRRCDIEPDELPFEPIDPLAEDTWVTRLLKQEPALITGLATALVAVLVAYGAPITDEQTRATVAFVGIVFAFVQAVATRSFVSSPATVARIEAQAAADVANAYTVGANDAERGAIVPATQ